MSGEGERLPAGEPAIVIDRGDPRGNDLRLLAWAKASGRLRFYAGVQHIDILHDDGCPRENPTGKHGIGGAPGRCSCKPHIRVGIDIVKWEDSPMGRE